MRLLRAALVAVLTLGLLWLALRSVDFRALAREVSGVHAGWLTLAILLSFLHYVLRAWRWDFLLRPVGRAPFAALLSTILMGYAVNNVLFGRIGEVARPLLLARRTSVPAAGALASIFLERVLDLAAILALLGASLPILLPGWLEPGQRGNALLIAWSALALAGAVAATIVAILLLLRYRDSPVVRWFGRLSGWIPERARRVMQRLLDSFIKGLQALRSGRLLLPIALLSFAIWVDLGACLWATARSFHAPFPFAGAFFLMGLIAAGMTLPTPGGVGSYHAAARAGLELFFRVEASPAAGIALLSHAVGYIPQTAIGLALLFREGMTPGKVRRAIEQPAEEKP